MFKNKHRTICGIEAAYRTEYAYYLVLEMAQVSSVRQVQIA